MTCFWNNLHHVHTPLKDWKAKLNQANNNKITVSCGTVSNEKQKYYYIWPILADLQFDNS